MAGKSAILTVKILTDASQSSKGLDQAAGGFKDFEKNLDTLVPAAAVAAGGIALVGKAAYDSASRTEQAMGALDSVFGKNADTVKGWAADAAQSVGLSKSEYGELASVIGAQLNNLGVSADDALSGTKDLIGIGSDLAATFGGSTSQAVEALSSALRGEADPAERYGLSLNQTAVNAKLAEDGLSDLTGSALKTAKTQAILELATEQSGGALGQFGRESDTAAGSSQRAAAEFENASSALGEALLPVVAKVATALGKLANWISQNTVLVSVLLGVVGVFAGAILLVSGAMKVWNTVQAAWKIATAIGTAVQWAFNAALAANPIGLIVIAVIALIAVFVLLWTKVAGFRNFFIAVWKSITNAAVAAWNWIKSAASNVVQFLTAYIRAYLAVVLGVWNAIKSAAVAVWNWISQIVGAAIGIIKGQFQLLGAVANQIWNGIRSVVDSVVGSIRSTLAGLSSFASGIWNGILDAGRSVFNTLRDVVGSVIDAIRGPIQSLADAFYAVVDAVRGVIDWIGRIRIPDLSALNPFKSAASSSSSAAAAPSSSLRGVASPTFPRSGGGSTSSSGITININGGLDSADTIARRVEQLLSARDRRSGGVTIRRRTA